MSQGLHEAKSTLRKHLRKKRKEQVASLPDEVRALILNRPPAPLLQLIPHNAVIGLYHATENEAPAHGYARFFHESGHRIALPRFADETSAMKFAEHSDPFEEVDCEIGPFGISQPSGVADLLTPDVLFVPLLGFTETGERLGQGGGHYDRWLAKHPDTFTVGLAWDCQLVDAIPIEEHDQRLNAIVTPTRMYGPF